MMKFILSMLAAGVFLAVQGTEQITLALACSSACQTYGNTDSKLIFGWGEVLDEFLDPSVKILNFARSGYSTKTFFERGNWTQLVKAKPNYALLALGANDNPPKKDSTTLDQYRKNLRKQVADCRAAGIKPIFVTLNQSMTYAKNRKDIVFSKQGPFRKDRAPYSQVIREVAKEEGLPCLELFDTQFRYMSAMGEAKCAALYRYDPQKQKLDPSHTNREGARFVAMIIAEQLAKSGSPLASKVKMDKVEAAKKEFLPPPALR